MSWVNYRSGGLFNTNTDAQQGIGLPCKHLAQGNGAISTYQLTPIQDNWRTSPLTRSGRRLMAEEGGEEQGKKQSVGQKSEHQGGNMLLFSGALVLNSSILRDRGREGADGMEDAQI